MKHFHIVRKQGYFYVLVIDWPYDSIEKIFHSYEGAMRFYRYHVSFLGWKFGSVKFIPSNYEPAVSLGFTDRVGK